MEGRRIKAIALMVALCIALAGCTKAAPVLEISAQGVFQVEIRSSLEDGSSRVYTAQDKIDAVLNYLCSLSLKDPFDGDNENDGRTFEITLYYESGEKTVLYHAGNTLLGMQTEDSIRWGYMEYEKAILLDELIGENESDSRIL